MNDVDKHGNCSKCGGVHFGTGRDCVRPNWPNPEPEAAAPALPAVERDYEPLHDDASPVGIRASAVANATYLGDGLYASYDGYQIKLFASDGIHTTNTVYLDGNVIVAFQQFVAKITEEAK